MGIDRTAVGYNLRPPRAPKNEIEKRFFKNPTKTASFTKTPFAKVQLCFLEGPLLVCVNNGPDRYRSPDIKPLYKMAQPRPKYPGSGSFDSGRAEKIFKGNIYYFPPSPGGAISKASRTN